MSDVVHRTTKQYLKSANTPDYPVETWIINPDLSAVEGFPSKYWIITGDVVTLMSQAERDAVDAAEKLLNEQNAGKRVGAITPVRLAASVTNSTVNFANVGGLSWQLAANSHYVFEITGVYTAAAPTTGLQIAVNGPASPVMVRAVGNIGVSSSSSVLGVAAAYDVAIGATSSGGSTGLPFTLNGNISTGPTAGPFGLRIRSGVAGSAVTVISGSYAFLYGIA
jgi:hypothetical protein